MSFARLTQCSFALHRMVHDTDIVELELKSKKFSLAVRKKEALKQPEPLYQVRCTWTCCTWTRAYLPCCLTLNRPSTFLNKAPPQMPPPQYGLPPPAQAAAPPPAPAPSSSSSMPSAPSTTPAAPSEKPKAEGVQVRLFCLLTKPTLFQAI